jgi:hypothetical protein
MASPERKAGRRILLVILGALLILLVTGTVSAGESITTLSDRTLTITGDWELNQNNRIPFTIKDFTGFRFMNLSYHVVIPTQEGPAACGLVFRLTTDEYLAASKNGTNLVYVYLGPSKVYNDGFLTFDPRSNPESPWQKGKYWIIVSFMPKNCVNDARIKLDLVRDTEGITLPSTPLPPATTPVAAPQGTTSAPAITVKEQAALPGTTQVAVGSGTPVTSPTKPPLPGYIPCLAVMAAILVFGGRLAGR